MPDPRRVEPDGTKGKLHDRPGAERTDDRPDSDRSAQQPADEGRRTEQRDADQRDGKFSQAFGQAYHQGVSRAAAQGSHHIGILRISQDKQACNHNRDRCEQRLAR